MVFPLLTAEFILQQLLILPYKHSLSDGTSYTDRTCKCNSQRLMCEWKYFLMVQSGISVVLLIRGGLRVVCEMSNSVLWLCCVRPQ